MTDAADNKDNATNGAAPEMTAEQGEQLRVAMIESIAQQALQVLTLVGIGVPIEQLRKGAAQQLDVQAQLLAQMKGLFIGEGAQKLPVISAKFSRPSVTTLILPGQPPAAAFPIAGPKRLVPNDHIPNAIGTLSTLAFMLHPHLRLVVNVLGIHVEFQQFQSIGAPPPARSAGKWRGSAR